MWRPQLVIKVAWQENLNDKTSEQQPLLIAVSISRLPLSQSADGPYFRALRAWTMTDRRSRSRSPRKSLNLAVFRLWEETLHFSSVARVARMLSCQPSVPRAQKKIIQTYLTLLADPQQLSFIRGGLQKKISFERRTTEQQSVVPIRKACLHTRLLVRLSNQRRMLGREPGSARPE